jgi:hypothetical protein
VEDVKPVLLKKQRISTGNHFEEEDFYPDELSGNPGGFHPVCFI